KSYDMLCNDLAILLERKVTGIKQMDLTRWQIATKCRRPGRCKDWIILSPHGQQRRLMLAEVLLPLWIAFRIRAIVLEERQLDLGVAWTIQSPLIKGPGIGADMVRLAHPLGILPASGLGCQQTSDRLLSCGGAVRPEGSG